MARFRRHRRHKDQEYRHEVVAKIKSVAKQWHTYLEEDEVRTLQEKASQQSETPTAAATECNNEMDILAQLNKQQEIIDQQVKKVLEGTDHRPETQSPSICSAIVSLGDDESQVSETSSLSAQKKLKAATKSNPPTLSLATVDEAMEPKTNLESNNDFTTHVSPPAIPTQPLPTTLQEATPVHRQQLIPTVETNGPVASTQHQYLPHGSGSYNGDLHSRPYSAILAQGTTGSTQQRSKKTSKNDKVAQPVSNANQLSTSHMSQPVPSNAHDPSYQYPMNHPLNSGSMQDQTGQQWTSPSVPTPSYHQQQIIPGESTDYDSSREQTWSLMESDWFNYSIPTIAIPQDSPPQESMVLTGTTSSNNHHHPQPWPTTWQSNPEYNIPEVDGHPAPFSATMPTTTGSTANPRQLHSDPTYWIPHESNSGMRHPSSSTQQNFSPNPQVKRMECNTNSYMAPAPVPVSTGKDPLQPTITAFAAV